MMYRGVEVLYCDNHLLVAVKPPNMPAQADASGDLDLLTLMKAYVKETYQKPGAVYLGLLHRLDRPVGGLMAFARTSKAAARLSEQLRTHAMRREYRAVARGETPPEGDLEHWLLQEGAFVRAVPSQIPEAKRAALHYCRLDQRRGLSLLEVRLETGRKHQIRVQLAAAGFPLWGDARYGGGQPGEQIALWGVKLALTHPTLNTPRVFISPPPKTAPWDQFDPPEIE